MNPAKPEPTNRKVDGSGIAVVVTEPPLISATKGFPAASPNAFTERESELVPPVRVLNVSVAKVKLEVAWRSSKKGGVQRTQVALSPSRKLSSNNLTRPATLLST